MKLQFLYLAAISIVSGAVFAYDKIAKASSQKRIKETYLHVTELMGGALINLILIYILRHKNRRPEYYIYTWLIGLIWIFALLSSMN